MRDLPLSLLRSLAAIRTEGGVRQAAFNLGVEHSTVSRALRDLEAWVGVPLIEPAARGARVRLTPQGAELADIAVSSIRDLEHATIRLREARSAKRVVIATPPSIANRWLLPRLERIEEACPGVEISVVVDTMRLGGLDPLADLSLRMGSRPKTDHAIFTIGSDRVFPIIAPALWESADKPDLNTALKTLPLLHDRDVRTTWAGWKEAFGPTELDTRSGARFTSADLVLRAAERGRGIALTRDWLARDALQDGSLKRLDNDHCIHLKDEWWLAEHDRKSTRSIVSRVRDWLLKEGQESK